MMAEKVQVDYEKSPAQSSKDLARSENVKKTFGGPLFFGKAILNGGRNGAARIRKDPELGITTYTSRI